MANNIINVSFGCVTRKTITLKWQYDEGQIISFDDITLPTAFECHFANTGDSTAERYLGQDNQVEIPAKYFWSGRPIDCYVVTVDPDSKQTAYKLTINVYNRPPQDGIEPSGDQKDIIEQAIDALNTAVDRSEAAAQDAEESAQAIQNMSVDANTLTTGSEATVTKSVDPDTGAVNLTFGIPEGEQGPKGDSGDTGATPAFAIGTVSTLEPGASATASITGTAENPRLNLGIPKGAKGDTGESGTVYFTVYGEAGVDVITGENINEVTATMTFDEVYNALEAGKVVYADLDYYGAIATILYYYDNSKELKYIRRNTGYLICFG